MHGFPTPQPAILWPHSHWGRYWQGKRRGLDIETSPSLPHPCPPSVELAHHPTFTHSLTQKHATMGLVATTARSRWCGLQKDYALSVLPWVTKAGLVRPKLTPHICVPSLCSHVAWRCEHSHSGSEREPQYCSRQGTAAGNTRWASRMLDWPGP